MAAHVGTTALGRPKVKDMDSPVKPANDKM